MKLTRVALVVAAASAIGGGILAVPARAGSPPLPPVSAEDLMTSVLTAKSPALGDTVTVHNALGLPARCRG
jgi:hypothetical protein